MKFSREQELFLIGLGIDALLSYRTSPVVVVKARKSPSNKGKQWTPEQRRKFSETMKKKWKERKNNAS